MVEYDLALESALSKQNHFNSFSIIESYPLQPLHFKMKPGTAKEE